MPRDLGTGRYGYVGRRARTPAAPADEPPLTDTDTEPTPGPLPEPVKVRLEGPSAVLQRLARAMRAGLPLTIPRLAEPRRGRQAPMPGESWAYLMRFDVTAIGAAAPTPATPPSPPPAAPTTTASAPAATRSGTPRRQAWHPVRPGDLVLLWSPLHQGSEDDYGATYLAVDSPSGPDDHGNARLLLVADKAHTPRQGDADCITTGAAPVDLEALFPSNATGPRPLENFQRLWDTAGSRLLCVIRAGRVVHGHLMRDDTA